MFRVNNQEVMLRKVITIQDLTLCLDKMDASGKIEIYQVFLRYTFTFIVKNLKDMMRTRLISKLYHAI